MLYLFWNVKNLGIFSKKKYQMNSNNEAISKPNEEKNSRKKIFEIFRDEK